MGGGAGLFEGAGEMLVAISQQTPSYLTVYSVLSTDIDAVQQLVERRCGSSRSDCLQSFIAGSCGNSGRWLES